MPLLGSMELEKINLRTKNHRNEKVTPSGHLAGFCFVFFVFVFLWLLILLGVSPALLLTLHLANLNPQFQSPQWPTWVVDTLEWDLTLNMVWQLDSGYFIYLWPRLYRDSSKNLTQKQAFPKGDTVIKSFNPIYLPIASILYFPVCLLFFNGFQV